MVREIRNVDGEVVDVVSEEASSDSEWSVNIAISNQTLILIGGGVLLLLGFMPGFFSTLFKWILQIGWLCIKWIPQAFDFHNWAWWYYPLAAIVFLFCMRWVVLYFTIDDDEQDDEYRTEEVRHFRRMSLFLSIEVVLLMVGHSCKWFHWPWWYLKIWCSQGMFSWQAFAAFLVIFTSIGISFYFVKTWIVKYFFARD